MNQLEENNQDIVLNKKESLYKRFEKSFYRYKEIAFLSVVAPFVHAITTPHNDIISLIAFASYFIINKSFLTILNDKFNFHRVDKLVDLKIIFLFLLLISESEIVKSITGNSEAVSFVNIGFKVILYMIITVIALNLSGNFKDLTVLMNKYRKSLTLAGVFGILIQILDMADKFILKGSSGSSKVTLWEIIVFIILIAFVVISTYSNVCLAKVFYNSDKKS